MKCNVRIKVGYSMKKWENKIKSPFFWQPAATPHILISGITGGGKTVLSQWILCQLLDTDANIFICDFKAGGDWDGILQQYAEYADCDKLFDEFYNGFIQTIEQRGCVNHYLVFDEFTSFMLAKDSKAFKSTMAKVSHIAFMGRSFGYHLIFISQQFNAKVLDTAIREQFGIKIYMGSTISTESATMLFPNCDINKSAHLPKHCGYISLPEKELDVVQMPLIKNPKMLKNLLINKGHP